MAKLVPHHHAMTIEEIAAEIGCTPDSVKHTLRRALKKLKDGRAVKMKDLAAARDREAYRGLPRIVQGCIC